MGDSFDDSSLLIPFESSELKESRPEHLHAAEAARDRLARKVTRGSEAVRRRLGWGVPASATSERRLAAVLELLRGTPPGVVARREGIAEPDLYRMPEAALAAATAALEGELPGSDDDMRAALDEPW